MPSAYLLVASAAVHACACALFGTLFALRGASEHRAFALLAAFLCAFVASGAVVELAPDDVVRAGAARAVWAFGPFAAAAFVDFGMRFGRPRASPLVGVAYVIAALCALYAAFGAVVEVVEGDVAAGRPVLRPLPGAAIVTVTVLGLLGVVAVALRRLAARDREADLVGRIAFVALPVAAIGEALRWTRGTTLGLETVAGTFVVCATSVVLLQRFAATAAGLAAQTAALEAATRALERTREEQVRKGQLAALGELSASVAHEVRNPLAIMKNAISGLKRGTLEDADRATLLSIVSEETERLSRLVRDLLAFARPRRESDATTQLRPLVEAALAEVHRSARAAAGVAIDVRVPNALAVSGDPELLRLAISNVIENAVHAMPRGGALTIDARTLPGAAPPTIEILFRDDGEGMDAAVLEKALDPFFTTRAAGAGLGLAIVDNVVRSHGGQVTIESEPGAGTTVSIRVPLVRPAA